MDEDGPTPDQIPFGRLGECQRCGGDGAFHITEVVNGAPRAVLLCTKCAGEHLRAKPPGNSESG